MRPIVYLYAGAAIAAAAAGGVIAWRVWQKGEDVAEAAGEVIAAVNPLNPDNVAAKAVNTVVQRISGDDTATLGTKAWEFFNPGKVAEQSRINDPVRIEKPAPGSGQGAAPAIGAQGFGDDVPLETLVGGMPVTPFWYGAP